MDSPQVAQHRQGAARVLLLADELDGLAVSDSRAYLTGIDRYHDAGSLDHRVGCLGPAPHDTSDESGGPRGVSGRAPSGGHTARGSGNLEIWNPESLRGCGACQVPRFSGFHRPGPRPALAAVRRGQTPARRDDSGHREARQNLLTATDAACATVTAGCCRDLRVEEPGHFYGDAPERFTEISFSQPGRDE